MKLERIKQLPYTFLRFLPLLLSLHNTLRLSSAERHGDKHQLAVRYCFKLNLNYATLHTIASTIRLVLRHTSGVIWNLLQPFPVLETGAFNIISYLQSVPATRTTKSLGLVGWRRRREEKCSGKAFAVFSLFCSTFFLSLNPFLSRIALSVRRRS